MTSLTHLSIALVVAFWSWIAWIVVRARRASRHVFDETVRPFDPAGSNHQGWVDTRRSQDDAYRDAPGAHPAFAIRCALTLVPGEREGGLALRKWRVVDRQVEQHPFGLRVSTGEVLAVVLAKVDERVALDVRPQGGHDGQLECVASLPDRERVEIEGTVESTENGRVLKASRLSVLLPGSTGDGARETSRSAFRWILVVGMLGLGALLVVTKTSFVVACVFWVAVLFYAWLNPHQYGGTGRLVVSRSALRFFGWAYRGARNEMGDPQVPEKMPTYTTHDVLRFPLDVVAPGPVLRHEQKGAAKI